MTAMGVPEEEQAKPEAKAKSPTKKPDPSAQKKPVFDKTNVKNDFERAETVPLNSFKQPERTNKPSYGLQKENNSTFSSSRPRN